MNFITYKDEILTLIDEFMEIGYMAEDVKVHNFHKDEITIKRSNNEKSMQIFASTPFNDNSIIELDKFLSDVSVDLRCFLIVDSEFQELSALKNSLNKFEIFQDRDDEFGSMYGTKIISGSLKDKLTKSLFLIGKDGAIYYIDMPENLSTSFDLERLRIELNKVYQSYNGVGCHG